MNKPTLTRLSRHAAVCLVAIGVMAWRIAPAARAADNSRQIVLESQKRSTAKSQRNQGLLQSFDASGKNSEKRWTMERLGAHGRSKTIIRFTYPAEVKGVGLLVVNSPNRASDQWMWTPAIERDRRITLHDRSTRFFGTDFTFEDLEERDVDRYDYTLLGEEAVDGVDCWKILSTPKQSKASQYSKSIVWIRNDSYAFARIDFYVGDQAVRQMNYQNIVNVQGYWTPTETVVKDLRRGTLTRLAVDKVEYDLPLKEESFTQQALRRP